VFVLEDFEAGKWPTADWVPIDAGGSVAAGYAHDGSFGILDPGWHYQNIGVTVGAVGDLLSAWVYFPTTSGRVYLGFDATGSGGKSFVIGPNSSQIMMQDNASWGYVEYAHVSYTFTAAQWYLAEVEFFKGGEVEGRLYDSDGVTLLTSTSYTYPSGLSGGGLSLRSFDGVYTDTIELR